MAKAYARRVKQTPSDKGFEKARKYVNKNVLVAVTNDKGVGFCVGRKDIYENKLSDLLDLNLFSESKGTSDVIVMNISTQGRGLLGAARQALWVGEGA